MHIATFCAGLIALTHGKTVRRTEAEFGNYEAEEVEKLFQAGRLLSHMKSDKTQVREYLGLPPPPRVWKSAERWAKAGQVDPGLSLSLLHPQFALQTLWAGRGWLFDATHCAPVAGSVADLWVNNMIVFGAEKTLSTLATRRAELLRLLWLHREGGALAHFPPMYVATGESLGGWESFVKWATHPEEWSAEQKGVFLAPNKMGQGDAWTIVDVPPAEDLARMLAAAEMASSWHELAEDLLRDGTGQFAPDRVRLSGTSGTGMGTYSEVLALCPLAAVRGFLYRSTDEQGAPLPAQDLATSRNFGTKVLEAARKVVPQALVIAEYATASQEGIERTVERRGGQVRFPAESEAKLVVQAVMEPNRATLTWRS